MSIDLKIKDVDIKDLEITGTVYAVFAKFNDVGWNYDNLYQSEASAKERVKELVEKEDFSKYECFYKQFNIGEPRGYPKSYEDIKNEEC